MKAPLHSMLLNNHSVKWIWHVKGSLCGCLVHKLAIYTALDTAYPFYYLCLGALNDQKFGSLNLSNVLGVRPILSPLNLKYSKQQLDLFPN